MKNEEKNYILLELTYIKMFDDKMFPNDWYDIIDYNIKIKILNEAIKNNILISETNEYRSFSEKHLKYI